MSRQRGASSMQRPEQVAQDLIARRIPARAGELLEIIHAINPTGRSLGAADERRRYELEARGRLAARRPHVFLGHLSVDDGRLRERRYLRAPAPLGELISATVDGDALWLIGDAGRVLQVSRTTGEPVRWLSLDPFLTGGERIERGFVASGGKHLWLEVSQPGGAPLDRVIEIEPWRLRRELPTARSFQPLVAGSSSEVIGTGLDGGAVRYTERGGVVEEIFAPALTRPGTGGCRSCARGRPRRSSGPRRRCRRRRA